MTKIDEEHGKMDKSGHSIVLMAVIGLLVVVGVLLLSNNTSAATVTLSGTIDVNTEYTGDTIYFEASGTWITANLTLNNCDIQVNHTPTTNTKRKHGGS